MMKLRCFSDEKLFDLLKDACLKESIFWPERKFFSESEELVTPAERDEMLAYLLEVCERSDMSFSIETFSLTVTLVDRFLASYKVKSKYLECLAVSCLYISAKVKEEDEKISITSEFLYDCNSKCSVSELLRMEIMILSKFEWSVDSITAADFLYIFHAMLVNKYNQLSETHKPNVVKNKWNVNFNRAFVLASDSAFPPADLDFLHSLEYKLKQVLCNHELATVFRSKVISLALISLQVEKAFEKELKENADGHDGLLAKSMVYEVLQILRMHAKITEEVLMDCKNKVKLYLETIDADRNLLESYMDQYCFEMARNHRASSRLSVTLSAIAKPLTAIKEEDETEEQEMPESGARVLSSISNRLNHTMASNLPDDKKLTDFSFNSSYAEIAMKGYRDHKRKLSENSITDEDYEFDCENRN